VADASEVAALGALSACASDVGVPVDPGVAKRAVACGFGGG